jgi:diacylglycerol O-acyltransferase
MPLYVAGARALTYTPVSIPFHGMAFNTTVYSYDGRLFFGLTGCRRAVPDIHDIALSITDEFHVLQRGARRRSAGRRQAKR